MVSHKKLWIRAEPDTTLAVYSSRESGLCVWLSPSGASEPWSAEQEPCWSLPTLHNTWQTPVVSSVSFLWLVQLWNSPVMFLLSNNSLHNFPYNYVRLNRKIRTCTEDQHFPKWSEFLRDLRRRNTLLRAVSQECEMFCSSLSKHVIQCYSSAARGWTFTQFLKSFCRTYFWRRTGDILAIGRNNHQV